jgi:hypothetical protein
LAAAENANRMAIKIQCLKIFFGNIIEKTST